MVGDRLSGLDASFLHIEDASAHMHVASVTLFEGAAARPTTTFWRPSSARLQLVPRYRQRLASSRSGRAARAGWTTRI